MENTTRKSETTTGAAKPASRRKTAPASPTGAEKVTTRRRTKSRSESAQPPVTADSRPAKAARPVQAAPIPEPTHEEISIRAYHIYLRRVGRPGSPESDWLQAIGELRATRGLL